jgi:hypothetical protein
MIYFGLLEVKTMQYKNNLIKYYSILVLLLISLTSCASAIPTITSIATNPAQPVVGEPFSITVTTHDGTITDSFDYYYDSSNNYHSGYAFTITETAGITTGTATVSNAIINDAGTHYLGIIIGSGHWQGIVTGGIYITVVEKPAASIPEFPTVAAPVAAILGLIVIFGHKK